MKWLSLLFLTCLFTFSLAADERVVSTLDNVDLIAVDRKNTEEHNYGTDYFALNRNQYLVSVKIRIKSSTNTQNELITTPITINPDQRGYLGSLIQDDTKSEAKWNIEWEVKKG